MAHAAVFLDRDGTVIEDCHYLNRPEQVRLLPGAVKGLRRLRDLGFPLVLITNQSGVGRGYFPIARVGDVHARLATMLEAVGIRLERIYFCPHTPDDHCACRKPNPGMLLAARRDLGIDLPASWVIGDKPSDVETAHRVGARGLLIGAAGVPDLPAAAGYIAANL